MHKFNQQTHKSSATKLWKEANFVIPKKKNNWIKIKEIKWTTSIYELLEIQAFYAWETQSERFGLSKWWAKDNQSNFPMGEYVFDTQQRDIIKFKEEVKMLKHIIIRNRCINP